MGTRADLLKAAEEAASRAIKEDASWKEREFEVRTAKVALEAAALVDDVGPGEISQALGALADEIAEAGLIEAALEAPVDYLRYTLVVMRHWRERADELVAYQTAYSRVATLAATLERDFTAADTETSRRLAARIHAALEECAALLPAMTDEEE